MTQKLTVHFESDWHIGSGSGIPGYIDRQVVRDHDGLPFVPGKTLTGILRDAAEFVADQLGDEYASSLDTLLGTQIEDHRPRKKKTTGSEKIHAAKVSIRPARLSPGVRKVLRENTPLIAALGYIQPHVCIDENTGCAKADHLFFIEQIRGGLALESAMEVSGELSEKEKAIWDKSLKAVRRMGGKRRRGGGKCRLASEILTPKPKPPGSMVSVSEDGGWLCVGLTLSALTPIIINRATLGNVGESRGYIPGSYLLGHLGKTLGISRKSIVNGDVYVTDFIPMLDKTNPGIPAPCCLSVPKEGSDKVYNLLRHQRPAGVQTKDIRDGWIDVQIGESKAIRYDNGNEHKIQRTHNTVEDEKQRPTEQVGGVYTYEALRPGLTFYGELHVRASSTYTQEWARQTCGTLTGRITVGQSSKDDYGLMDLNVVKSHGSPSKAARLAQEKYLVLQVMSDILIRDDRLMYSAHPDCLCRELNRNMPEAKLSIVSVNPFGGDVALASRGRRTDSWHTGWTLPRPSLVGIQAGSVFIFEASGKWDGALAEQLELRGIGDRRAEGFGRIAFNPCWLEENAFRTIQKLETPHVEWVEEELHELTEEETSLLREIETAYWKEKIRRFARLHAFGTNFLNQPVSHWPKSSSQIGALRDAIHALQDEYAKQDARYPNGWKTIIQWLGYNVARDNSVTTVPDTWRNTRKKAWEKLRGTLLDLFVNPGSVWTHLTIDPASVLQGPGETVNLKRCLWPFAIRALIEMICERIAKKEGGKCS